MASQCLFSTCPSWGWRGCCTLTILDFSARDRGRCICHTIQEDKKIYNLFVCENTVDVRFFVLLCQINIGCKGKPFRGAETFFEDLWFFFLWRRFTFKSRGFGSDLNQSMELGRNTSWPCVACEGDATFCRVVRCSSEVEDCGEDIVVVVFTVVWTILALSILGPTCSLSTSIRSIWPVLLFLLLLAEGLDSFDHFLPVAVDDMGMLLLLARDFHRYRVKHATITGFLANLCL